MQIFLESTRLTRVVAPPSGADSSGARSVSIRNFNQMHRASAGNLQAGPLTDRQTEEAE